VVVVLIHDLVDRTLDLPGAENKSRGEMTSTILQEDGSFTPET
jgi:hypothetical protein